MFNPDFSDRTYTAEVIKCNTDGNEVLKTILKLAIEPKTESQNDEVTGSTITVAHGFLASNRQFHRFPKFITAENGKEIAIPRQRKIRDIDCYLYDVFVAHCRNHIVVAVPFHDLGEDFFVRVDRRLGGTNIRYQKLDITAMVMRLGASGGGNVTIDSAGVKTGLSVTRCHLSYVDQKNRTTDIQQVCMTGANLGASKDYRALVDPVLKPESSKLTVTPIILGFALSVNGVRKSSATTDRYGNFKIWIAPGLRRLIRLFNLLETIETMKNLTLTTGDIPILQSDTIRNAEDKV